MEIVQHNLFDGKVCPRCKERKPFADFHKLSQAHDGYQVYCKVCKSALAVPANEADRARLNKQKQKSVDKWRAAHKEQYQAWAKLYAQEYYEAHKQELSASTREYAKAHPEYGKATRQRYYARKRSAGGSFTAREWNALCAKYDHCCLCCGQRKRLEADHVIPISQDGSNNIENIQPLCRSCNASKGTKVTDYRRD